MDKIAHQADVIKDHKQTDNLKETHVCSVCGKTSSKVKKVDVLFVNLNGDSFKKIQMNPCRSCLNGGWIHWFIALTLLIILTLAILIFGRNLVSVRRICFIFLLALPFLQKIISDKFPLKFMTIEPIKNITQNGYTIAYIHQSVSSQIKGEIAFSEKHGLIYITDEKAYLCLNGRKGKKISLRDGDIVWRVSLKKILISARPILT
ncbi:MAG: hypothetical protein LBT83_05680 [Tannerella sp.]|nr:hypothetical protein [Tannerella sp.]